MTEILLEEEMPRYVGTRLQSQDLGAGKRKITSLKITWAT